MKSFINILAVVFFAAIALSSCSIENTDYQPQEMTVESTKDLKVNCVILDTKSSETLKNTWNENDWIYLFSNGQHTFFRANEGSQASSFSLCSSANGFEDGAAFAVYPKTVKFSEGQAQFSLAGQTGSYKNVDKYGLMTAASTVKDCAVNFAFTSNVTVLAFEAAECIYEGASLTSVTVSGEEISSNIDLTIEGSNLSVKSEGNGSVVIDRPVVEEDGMVYVVIPATNGSEINVTLTDSFGATFTASIEEVFSPGQIYDITNAQWEGGLEVVFNPGVAGWENK